MNAALTMGDVVPYRSPRTRAETTAWLGMVLFLASWAMMFACFFFAYGMLRARAPTWPPLDAPEPPLGLAAANTLVLALSSAALQAALRAARADRRRSVALGVGAAALGGALFLGLQSVLWARLRAQGLTWASGPYASVLYGLTALHAAHVLAGLGALAWLALRATRGAYGAARHLPVRLWTMYWHFVGVVWALMFALVFLI